MQLLQGELITVFVNFTPKIKKNPQNVATVCCQPATAVTRKFSTNIRTKKKKKCHSPSSPSVHRSTWHPFVTAPDGGRFLSGRGTPKIELRIFRKRKKNLKLPWRAERNGARNLFFRRLGANKYGSEKNSKHLFFS